MTQEVLVIGTGFAGLGMGFRLKQAGIHDFTILEQGEGVGGTWRDNHYPGAACDIQSHLYSFSFAPNPDWSRMFAPQREILAYLERCTDRFGLRPHIRFGTRVVSVTFDDAAGLWEVRTSVRDEHGQTRAGETHRARVIVTGTGGLSRPAYPDIPGLDRFRGRIFHSARWDHEAPLAGKTVAVIGTGASAIQIVPSIAPEVGRLHVFQRTPPWILPRPDRAIAGWERALFRSAPVFQKLARLRLWCFHELFAFGFVVDPRILRVTSRLALRFLEASVPDPALREKLTPRYTMGCKRVLLSNDYYPAIARSNVELVTEGIREVGPEGIVTVDGKERPVDAIVLATGFQASEACAPFPVRGRDGRDLEEVWRDGAEAYLGTTVSGFPNLFLVVGPNTGLGHNSMVYIIESQIQYVLGAIQAMRAHGWKTVDVRASAQARYNDMLRRRLARTVWATGGCRSWYLTSTGKNTTLWPGFTFEFRGRTRRFDPEAYEARG